MTPTRPRVLIVDNEPTSIRILAGLIRDQAESTFATSGADAINLARRQRPDLILLDLEMPGMDGLEVWRRLRTDPSTRHIGILFVTCHSERLIDSTALADVGIDFLSKPLQPRVVRARVRNHLLIKQQRDQLAALADLDGLTQCPNRRRAEYHLQTEWQLALQIDAEFGLAYVDLDHFSSYNQAFGHLAGDACLRTIAKTLVTPLRGPADLVAREGGDTFLILLPNTSGDALFSIAERLRKAVTVLELPSPPSSTHAMLTISLGIACCRPADQCRSASLFAQAKIALQQAKSLGGNQVCRAPLPTDSPLPTPRT